MSALAERLVAAAMSRGTVLRDSGRGAMSGGGTVSYTVEVDGRCVGWVGDERRWLGHTHGDRRWSAAWREVDDRHARWRTEGHHTRRAAVDALVQHVRKWQP